MPVADLECTEKALKKCKEVLTSLHGYNEGDDPAFFEAGFLAG